MACDRTYWSLVHLALGDPCPTEGCKHSPLAHTETGCSVCLAQDAAERVEVAIARLEGS